MSFDIQVYRNHWDSFRIVLSEEAKAIWMYDFDLNNIDSDQLRECRHFCCLNNLLISSTYTKSNVTERGLGQKDFEFVDYLYHSSEKNRIFARMCVDNMEVFINMLDWTDYELYLKILTRWTSKTK